MNQKFDSNISNDKVEEVLKGLTIMMKIQN